MTAPAKARPVVVVGANHLVRAGVAAVLGAAGHRTSCREWPPAGGGLDGDLASGATLVALPAVQDPRELLTALVPHHSRAVLVSPSVSPLWVRATGEANVGGFVHLHEPPAVLLDAVAEVAAGRCFHSPAFLHVRRTRLARTNAFFRLLSRREQQILAAVCRGGGEEEIATNLGISPLTVGVHRRNIRQKVGAQNDRDLVRYAFEWGLHPHAG